MTTPHFAPAAHRAPRPPAGLAARLARDPRHYQIAVLALLLGCGLWALDFEITPGRAALTLAATLAAQWACARAAGPAAGFEWRSALISGLSLCLLLRTSAAGIVLAAAALAIGSKFALRWNGRHLFNPTCFALVVLVAVTPAAWVSPGQWGHAALLGFAIACLGSVVVTRAARADVTFAFLGAWAAILFGRAAWLGQPWATPAHMISSGSILLFAFFMISDPRTTPASRAGRVMFAVLVALGAALVQFALHRTNGPLWSLAACALLVPFIDHWLPGARHHWTTDARLHPATKGPTHAPELAPVRA